MFSDDLFQKVLIKPYKDGADSLKIISGYANPNMANDHLSEINKLGGRINIDLVVGMTRRPQENKKKSGLRRIDHEGFKDLCQNGLNGSTFTCHYVVSKKPIHAKAYIWMKDERPVSAFIGSANYSTTAFGPNQTEVMTKNDAIWTLEFYEKCLKKSLSCLDPNIENKVRIRKRDEDFEKALQMAEASKGAISFFIGAKGERHERVSLSLLVKTTGETHEKAGLNWGQRKGRDKNQAYIPVPMEIARSDFFPDIGEPFTVLTDDNVSFIMVKAQQGGKALHTTHDNSLLGRYIRERLKVPSGEYVTKHHLEKYGRTDITFIKIDDESYLMDFSADVPSG